MKYSDPTLESVHTVAIYKAAISLRTAMRDSDTGYENFKNYLNLIDIKKIIKETPNTIPKLTTSETGYANKFKRFHAPKYDHLNSREIIALPEYIPLMQKHRAKNGEGFTDLQLRLIRKFKRLNSPKFNGMAFREILNHPDYIEPTMRPKKT